MPTLDPSLRDQLATVIGKETADTGARLVAEAGAKAAIEALAVQLASPYAHIDTTQKQLRNRLRAHARQLGDTRHADGRHEIGRLVEQAAYEHWHRMLFARFLAENDLLIHPEMGVAVTLEECAELAASEGAVDGWELAGRYASRMLPQIFRPDDPLLAVRFAIDDVKKLEALLDSLPAELFRASDSLGWCYQFWQARKKKEVNNSEVKIGADELPAVTQLFTEPYMVQFLLHNTLGAWWVGDGRTVPVEMPYLCRLDDGTPAASNFEGWPRHVSELKVLDPCCGSGHFLVAAFEILVAFRMAEESLSARDACDAVLRDNLYGLEIDARCVQIAAFALAMAAWTYPEAGGYRSLASMNVACSGLAISAKKEEWERLGGDDERLRAGMGHLWELFSDAPVLGSLIDPRKNPPNPLLVAGFDELAPMLNTALDLTRIGDEEVEATVAAKGLADAALILGNLFDLVCTNVPYLSKGKHVTRLREYCERYYSDASADLATVCQSRFLGLLRAEGTSALVLPQGWTYLYAYRNHRENMLRSARWRFVARLGAGAFRTISGEVVNVVLWIGQRGSDGNEVTISAIDASNAVGAEAKADLLLNATTKQLQQSQVLLNTDHGLTFEETPHKHSLADYSTFHNGLQTGDKERFVRCFWEVKLPDPRWELLQSAVSESCVVGGCHFVLRWNAATRTIPNAPGSVIRGTEAWGKPGVAVSAMGSLPASLYAGRLFDENVVVLQPKSSKYLGPIFRYATSAEYSTNVRKICQALKVRRHLLQVPFDQERWCEPENDPPVIENRDPTQWLFVGGIRTSASPIHVAVVRLLGCRWPDQQPDTLDAHVDTDGIVCIPALRGESPAVGRLVDLLEAAWGKDWHPQTLTDLLTAVGHKGTLEEWLRDAFFRQHCELFRHRPFIWHVWDGHREGFSALVNYHKLDHEGLKSLTYTYLGDWIRTQEIDANAGKSGAGDKLAKAKVLQQRLAAILAGEAPLDVFVRWKAIEEQPVGWHPELDDGVRFNIRPFLTCADVGAKGAGVLRWKPNIKWGKDKGKNPPGSPWGEDRDNDMHLKLEEKRAARGE